MHVHIQKKSSLLFFFCFVSEVAHCETLLLRPLSMTTFLMSYFIIVGFLFICACAGAVRAIDDDGARANTAAGDSYDVVVVGVGTAASFVLSQLVPKFLELSFVAIDAGDFVSSRLGASAPASASAVFRSANLTAVDIPGEYNNLAYTPGVDASYQNQEAAWAFQSKSWGGNSNFNGALFQVPSADSFQLWPEGWRAADLQPFFEKVMMRCNITTSPSADRNHYVNGSAVVLGRLAESLGSSWSDSPFLPGKGSKSVFGPPNVAVNENAERCFGTAQLAEVIDEKGRSKFSNLVLIRNATVRRVVLNGTSASGVAYTTGGSLVPHIVSVKPSTGRVLLGAGALFTPWILFQSGIGPQSLQKQVFPEGPPFVINNEGIGVRLFDHVGAALVLECPDYISYRSSAHSPADVDAYVAHRTGPFAQYGPVFYHFNTTSNVEVFSNPWGLGPAASGGGGDMPWNNQNTFAMFALNLEPRVRAFTELLTSSVSAGFNISYPMIYNNEEDMWQLAEALHLFVTALFSGSDDRQSAAATQKERKSVENCTISFGPGAPPFAGLDPLNLTDMFNYVNSWGPYAQDVWWSHLAINHFGGTAPLTPPGSPTPFGVSSETLLVGGVRNVHVVDASLLPEPTWAHPMGTVLAVAAKAAALLEDLLRLHR